MSYTDIRKSTHPSTSVLKRHNKPRILPAPFSSPAVEEGSLVEWSTSTFHQPPRPTRRPQTFLVARRSRVIKPSCPPSFTNKRGKEKKRKILKGKSRPAPLLSGKPRGKGGQPPRAAARGRRTARQAGPRQGGGAGAGRASSPPRLLRLLGNEAAGRGGGSRRKDETRLS